MKRFVPRCSELIGLFGSQKQTDYPSRPNTGFQVPVWLSHLTDDRKFEGQQANDMIIVVRWPH